MKHLEEQDEMMIDILSRLEDQHKTLLDRLAHSDGPSVR